VKIFLLDQWLAVLEWPMFIADTKQAQKNKPHFLSPKFDFVFLMLHNAF